MDGAAMRNTRRILYLQYVNPAMYPPLEHSSRILAARGWRVDFLGIESLDSTICFPPHPNIHVELLPYCPPGWRQKFHYLRLAIRALGHVLKERPEWVYISEPLSCAVALPLLCVPGLRLIYHEHDALGPTPTLFLKGVSAARRCIVRWADICVLPNRERAAAYHDECRPRGDTLIVWNCPTTTEAAAPHVCEDPSYIWALVPGIFEPYAFDAGCFRGARFAAASREMPGHGLRDYWQSGLPRAV